MKVPKITIDPKSLRRGIWNNTWRNWGNIVAAFLLLYAIEAGYFAGLLFASKRIRGQDYKTLPSQYFGNFLRQPNVYTFPYDQISIYFNPPEGCTEGTTTRIVSGVEITEPDGIQSCQPSKDNLGWVLFPWVQDTNGDGQFPGCAGTNDTVITKQSNPSFSGDTFASGDWQASICQNFVFVNGTVNSIANSTR